MSDRALRPVLRQRKDIGLRFMIILLGGIGICLFLMLGVAYLLFPSEIKDQKFALPLPGFPAPVLQPSPRVDMQAFHAEEMRQLNGAGWVNRANGTVHIPIDHAMRDVARDGIPGWPTSAAASEGERR